MNKLMHLVATAALASTVAFAEEKRQADAHEHGHGAFRMAIEDDHAEIEIQIPAFDIVGFEHAPSTPQQRDAIASAVARLARAGELFEVPAAAGCVTGQVEIGFGAIGGHMHDHGHDEDHDEHEADGHDDHEHEGEMHSEVTAYYRFACADTAALTSIDFGFFEAFANAEELEVVVLSASGQAAGEVDRNKKVFAIE